MWSTQADELEKHSQSCGDMNGVPEQDKTDGGSHLPTKQESQQAVVYNSLSRFLLKMWRKELLTIQSHPMYTMSKQVNV